MADNQNNKKRISASSFLGNNRYESYVNELISTGTIEGQNLSPSERKEAFKKRNNKVAFKTFVEKVLEKKAVATAKVKPIGIKSLKGTADPSKGGALIKYKPQPEAQKSSFAIVKSLDSILATLNNQLKFDKKQSDDDRKEEEKEKRSKRESALEAVKKVSGKIVDKVLAPFKSIMDRIWNFIFYTLLGRAFTKLMDWLGDPKNAQKVAVLGRFLKDWWPALLGLYFMPFKGFMLKTLGKIAWFGAKFALRNPAVLLTALGEAGSAKMREVTGKEYRLTGYEGVVPGVAPGAVPGKTPEKKTAAQVKENQEAPYGRNPDGTPKLFPSLFGSGGYVNANTGLKISGAGADTQLTALQPGEIVMNRAAVRRIGANNLLALNAKYGGPNANQPKFANDIQFAQNGGLIGGGAMGLRGPNLMRIMHGTAEGIPELIRQTGFRGQTGMLGKGVYGSTKGWVADTYRGAGAFKGIMPGQGPRLNMLVPQSARTFRGATVVSERQANRGLRIAEGILSGKYTGAKARSLMPLLTKTTPSMAQAFGSGALRLLGRAAGILNAPVIGDMLSPEAAGAGSTLQEAMSRGYYKGPKSFGKQGGGLIKENTGYDISGATADRQLTPLQPGEYVLPADTVSKLGTSLIDKLVAMTDSNSTPAKLGERSGRYMPGPLSRSGRGGVISLPPITQSAGGAPPIPSSSTQVPSFSAVSPSGGSDRATNASIYGIV